MRTYINKLQNKIGFWIFLKLYKIVQRSYLRNTKKLNNFSDSTVYLTALKLCIFSENYLLYSDDEYFDDLIAILVSDLLEIPLNEEQKSFKNKESQKLEELQNKIDSKISYLQEEKSNFLYTKKALEEINNLNKISANEFHEFIDLIKKRCKIITSINNKEIKNKIKETDKQIRTCLEIIRDKKREKLDFNKDIFIFFLQIASPLFLFIGFLYNYLYYNHFGIKIIEYSNLSDYVASSIDKIFYILQGGIISSFLIFWGDSDVSTFSEQQSDKHFKAMGKVIYCNVVISIVMVIAATVLYCISRKISLEILNILIIPISMISWHLSCSIAYKYFVSPRKAFFLLFFILMTLERVIYGVYSDISYTEIAIQKQPLEIYFLKDNKSVPINYIHIGSNSRYFFFTDKDANKLIIPSNEVTKISVTN